MKSSAALLLWAALAFSSACGGGAPPPAEPVIKVVLKEKYPHDNFPNFVVETLDRRKGGVYLPYWEWTNGKCGDTISINLKRLYIPVEPR